VVLDWLAERLLAPLVVAQEVGAVATAADFIKRWAGDAGPRT
jgi:hypothetical protein